MLQPRRSRPAPTSAYSTIDCATAPPRCGESVVPARLELHRRQPALLNPAHCDLFPLFTVVFSTTEPRQLGRREYQHHHEQGLKSIAQSATACARLPCRLLRRCAAGTRAAPGMRGQLGQTANLVRTPRSPAPARAGFQACRVGQPSHRAREQIATLPERQLHDQAQLAGDTSLCRATSSRACSSAIPTSPASTYPDGGRLISRVRVGRPQALQIPVEARPMPNATSHSHTRRHRRIDAAGHQREHRRYDQRGDLSPRNCTTSWVAACAAVASSRPPKPSRNSLVATPRRPRRPGGGCFEDARANSGRTP